jgi:hypothetical protein
MHYLKGRKLHFFLIPGLLITGAVVFYFFDPAKLVLFPKCPFFAFTGYYCPGCGSQRAIHSFLHFRWSDVVNHNFLVFPAALFIMYHVARSVLNKRFGVSMPDFLYRKWTPWIILGIVLVFWALRNLPFEPFQWLKPGV